MELEFRRGTISFERELSYLDKLVIKFAKILERQKVEYVIISGYIAILFGRSRNTEDVDLFVEKMPFGKFRELWEALYEEGFECINSSEPESAYKEYLKEMLSLRFAVKGTFEPNFELKFPKTDLNQYSLKNKLVVEINEERINTSRMELQIAFKLYLGSEKDIEDAIHLWQIFKDKLDMELFTGFVKRLKVEGRVGELE